MRVETLLPELGAAIENGDVAETRRLVGNVLALDPLHVGALEILRLDYARSGIWQGEVELGRRLMVVEPQDGDHAIALAGSLAKSAHFGEAVRSAKYALMSSPDNLEFAMKAASVLFSAGEFNAAWEICMPFLQAGAAPAGLVFMAGRALRKLGRISEAEALLKSVGEANPKLAGPVRVVLLSATREDFG